MDFGTAFCEFSVNLGATYVIFFMLVSRSRFAMIPGFEAGRPRLEIQAFYVRDVAKTRCSRILGF